MPIHGCRMLLGSREQPGGVLQYASRILYDSVVRFRSKQPIHPRGGESGSISKQRCDACLGRRAVMELQQHLMTIPARVGLSPDRI
jgi:hypothetical protein